MRFSFWMALALLVGAGCQSAQQRRLAVLKDRVEKLQPLSHWKPLKCRIEAHLTEPARARYLAMFPAESKALATGSLVYIWHAHERSSQIVAPAPSPLTQNYRSFLETTVGLLLQVHWVNSPFDDLSAKPDDILDTAENQVFIRSGPTGELGLYVDPKAFKVETRTRTHGVLTATYELVDGADWLPQSVAQNWKNTRVVLDRFEWESVLVSGRRMIKSVWLSVGEGEKVLAHSQLFFYDCESD